MITFPLTDKQIYSLSEDTSNPWVAVLDAIKTWAKEMNLQYIPSGSTLKELPPGHWCVKSYNYDQRRREAGGGIWNHRMICFNDADAKHAMLFKLRWGGQ